MYKTNISHISLHVSTRYWDLATRYNTIFFGGGGGVIASVLRYYLIEKGPSQHIALWALILSQHCQMFIQLFLL
jgi:type II secretory pathway component PulM